MKTAAPIVALVGTLQRGRATRTSAPTSRRCRRLLDRVDELIAGGVIGGEQPNAADFQIAPSIGLAMTLDDLRPAIEGRPAGELAKRVVPDFPGDTPPILPPAWLEPLRGQPPRPERARAPLDPLGSLPAGSAARRRRDACRRAGSAPGRARAAGRGRSGGCGPPGGAGSAARWRARCRRAAAGRRRAGAGRGAGASVRPRSTSIALQTSSRGSGSSVGADPDRGVEEVGLVEDLADRLGLVGRGDRLDLDRHGSRSSLDRGAQMPGAVADVGAETEVAGPRLTAALVFVLLVVVALARSWVTSTATSSIASGSGGSGLAARTWTDSQPKRSISARRPPGRAAPACGSCARWPRGRRCRRPRRSRSCPRAGR